MRIKVLYVRLCHPENLRKCPYLFFMIKIKVISSQISPHCQGGPYISDYWNWGSVPGTSIVLKVR